MLDLMTAFLKDESGAQLAEYALLLVLIGLLVVAAVLFLKDQIYDAFTDVGNCIASNTDCP